MKGGDWDVREEFSLRPGYPEPPRRFYFADRFEDTVIHRSLREHFVEGVQ